VQCHKQAVLKTITLPASTGNVGEMLPSHLAKQWLERRKCLLKLLFNVHFFSRQGLTFHVDVMTLAKIPLLHNGTKISSWKGIMQALPRVTHGHDLYKTPVTNGEELCRS